MSVSDMTYANGWLYNQEGSELWPWTISPRALFACANRAWVARGEDAGDANASKQYGVFPTVYLKSSIEIISGNGHDEPYILSV